jgi:hypothetical protein
MTQAPDDGKGSGRPVVGAARPTAERAVLPSAKPRAMHDAFEQFGAFSQDSTDNKARLAQGGKLATLVLGVGGRSP